MGFILKRKRSDSDLSMTSSQFSSPPRSRQDTLAPIMIDTDSCSPSRPRSSTPSHLPSRTMKRFRDNRPSDQEVHRRTLNMLYKAQNHTAVINQQPQQQHTAVASPFPRAIENSHNTPRGQQASLHRFFNIPGSEPSSTTSSVPPVLEAQSCDDCGSRASGSDGNDAVMDTDGYGFGSSAAGCGCIACGKVVCSQCSVSNLGEQRRCLVCADKKVWIGGIGWTFSGLNVC